MVNYLLFANPDSQVNTNTLIITGTLSVLGAFITAYFTSLRTVRTEKEKINSTIELTYANKLLEKRLLIYPEFYLILSDLAKSLFYQKFNKAILVEFEIALNELDSKHMIFCSSLVTNEVASLRRFIRAELAIQEEELTTDSRAELIKWIGNVENTLKHDLGIYIVELDDPQRNIDTLTYESIKSHYQKKKKRKLKWLNF